jgi:signal transduction histidine kinase
MSRQSVKTFVLVSSLLLAALLLTIGVHTTRWIGATFPGFFVMQNRVIASIALPGWLDIDPSTVFQHQVVAVDGERVTSAADVYAAARRAPAGSLIRYTLRAPDGRTTTAVVRSRVFSSSDYAFLFGAYLLDGLAFIATGLLVFLLKPDKPAGVGLLCSGVVTGLFVITAADLYGPHWFFRLHVVAESLLAAGLVHLALVFPTDRIRRHRGMVLAAVYLPFVLLALVYEIVLDSPSAYTRVHLATTATHALGGIVLIGAAFHDVVATNSPLVRRRISVAALGTLCGFLFPALLMGASALLGGSVPLNTAAITAVLFPLSLGYAVVKQDLFEIDVMLRRAMTYVIVVVTIATVYFVALLFVGWTLTGRELLVRSPAVLSVINLALLFLIAATRARVQVVVDRLFFRKDYNTEHALSDLSNRLASVHTIDDVIAHSREVVRETLCPVGAAIYLPEADGRYHAAGGLAASQPPFSLPADLAQRSAAGEILARYEWEDGSGQSVPEVWAELAADLLVPIRSGTSTIALLVLGAKRSGRAYTMHDIAFVRTAANQLALAISNARAFDQLETLNQSLGLQVRERTAALEAANSELNRSLADLQSAYQQLERSQVSLMRADRLATLGRLTAGIAHEVNTPLGAVMNSLKILTDLGREYTESIDDPSVGPEDHRQIADEMIATCETATGWARKAAAFISKVKMHGREPRPTVTERFAISAVVNETQALLSHRLRAASCRLELVEEARDICLVGESTRLGQVLVNLVANAIDAYEDANLFDGRIEITIGEADGRVVLSVRDWAGGIPLDVLPRIFDELFTTKEAGRGTGLGLWIARNLVEESFAGTLNVETVAGKGSCFTASFPAQDDEAQATPTPKAARTAASAPPGEGKDPHPPRAARATVLA